jgi:hypothetical protein
MLTLSAIQAPNGLPGSKRALRDCGLINSGRDVPKIGKIDFLNAQSKHIPFSMKKMAFSRDIGFQL